MKIFCFKCQKINDLGAISLVGRRDECLHCRADLHICKNCKHYDKNSYNECRETSADVVKEKERANFCDYFEAQSEGSVVDKAAQLKAAAEALFKK